MSENKETNVEPKEVSFDDAEQEQKLQALLAEKAAEKLKMDSIIGTVYGCKQMRIRYHGWMHSCLNMTAMITTDSQQLDPAAERGY